MWFHRLKTAWHQHCHSRMLTRSCQIHILTIWFKPILNLTWTSPICWLILTNPTRQNPKRRWKQKEREVWTLQERWSSVKWKERQREREQEGWLKQTREWEHLLPPLFMSALLCHPKTRVNRPTLCLCSSSSPILRAASLQSLQLPCRQFVFLPTHGFFSPSLFFLLLNQHFSSKYSPILQSGIFKVLSIAFLTSRNH